MLFGHKTYGISVISIMYLKLLGEKNKAGGLILGRDESGKFLIPSNECFAAYFHIYIAS